MHMIFEKATLTHDLQYVCLFYVVDVLLVGPDLRMLIEKPKPFLFTGKKKNNINKNHLRSKRKFQCDCNIKKRKYR